MFFLRNPHVEDETCGALGLTHFSANVFFFIQCTQKVYCITMYAYWKAFHSLEKKNEEVTL